MTRPTLQEVNFQEFKQALQRAVASGTRITPEQKERWTDYVARCGIREVNVRAYGAGKYPGLLPVIIDDDSSIGGYFLWSSDEEVALQWRSGS